MEIIQQTGKSGSLRHREIWIIDVAQAQMIQDIKINPKSAYKKSWLHQSQITGSKSSENIREIM